MPAVVPVEDKRGIVVNLEEVSVCQTSRHFTAKESAPDSAPWEFELRGECQWHTIVEEESSRYIPCLLPLGSREKMLGRKDPLGVER